MKRKIHPASTKAQQKILDEIGCGNYTPRMNDATRRSLLRQGLIVKCGEKRIGNPPYHVTVAEYQMPIPVHIKWCEFHDQGSNESGKGQDEDKFEFGHDD